MRSYKPILLADDNPHDAELALAAMDEDHLADKVAVCRDGTEVLDYLYRRGAYSNRSEGNPILIVLDLKMPRVDGLEVLRIIKQDAALSPIPVVMFTSSKEEFDVAQCYAAGVNAYVVKPVDFPDYVRAVRELGVFWGVINEPPPPGCQVDP
ncbi:response regulator [Nitrospira sp.]|nr:response regulator [Nitrospira sp.]